MAHGPEATSIRRYNHPERRRQQRRPPSAASSCRRSIRCACSTASSRGSSAADGRQTPTHAGTSGTPFRADNGLAMNPWNDPFIVIATSRFARPPRPVPQHRNTVHADAEGSTTRRFLPRQRPRFRPTERHPQKEHAEEQFQAERNSVCHRTRRTTVRPAPSPPRVDQQRPDDPCVLIQRDVQGNRTEREQGAGVGQRPSLSRPPRQKPGATERGDDMRPAGTPRTRRRRRARSAAASAVERAADSCCFAADREGA